MECWTGLGDPEAGRLGDGNKGEDEDGDLTCRKPISLMLGTLDEYTLDVSNTSYAHTIDLDLKPFAIGSSMSSV